MTVEEKRERNRLYNIAWRAKNQDKVKESQELFNERHPDRRKEISKKFRDSHKEKRKKEWQEYDKTKPGRASRIVRYLKQYDNDACRGECTITQKWVLENIFTSSCTYCGETDWRKLGCDRIDNTLPHTPENCVCACGRCNVERSNRWTVEEFREHKQKGQPPIEPPCHNSTPLN